MFGALLQNWKQNPETLTLPPLPPPSPPQKNKQTNKKSKKQHYTSLYSADYTPALTARCIQNTASEQLLNITSLLLPFGSVMSLYSSMVCVKNEPVAETLVY